MARGFGSLGAGITDIITTGLVTYPAQRSWFAWVYEVSTGGNGGGAGRIFNQVVGQQFESIDSTHWEFDAVNWSATFGQWQIPAPSLNAWHAIGVTYDNSLTTNNPVIYLDGVSQTVTRTGTPAGTQTTPTGAAITIGNRSTLDRNWDGGVAEFAVWDGLLLSGSDFVGLSTLVNGTRANLVQPGSLAGYWVLGGTLSPEPDTSGNGRDATVSGTAFMTGPLFTSPVSPFMAGGPFLMRM